jgi:hypothetical protein
MTTSLDEPNERRARALHARAERTGNTRNTFLLRDVAPDDPRLLARLDDWQATAAALLAGPPLSSEERLRLEDSARILAELARVLAGDEAGEGRSRDRHVTLAFAAGRTQGICAWFACRRGVFVELLATAPWNLVRCEPARIPRARAPGAGRALVAEAVRVSRALGAGGRVALQAENPRCAALYARLGFAAMRPSDAPLALVPQGDHGWSSAVLRLARGAPGPEEARAPWLVLDPARTFADVRAAA